MNSKVKGASSDDCFSEGLQLYSCIANGNEAKIEEKLRVATFTTIEDNKLQKSSFKRTS